MTTVPPALRAVLAGILKRQRWNDQGGYPGYHGNGKWDFVAASLTVKPEELNALFKAADIEPDVIQQLGPCSECRFARPNGTERGYDRPCLNCTRPRHSNFERGKPGSATAEECFQKGE